MIKKITVFFLALLLLIPTSGLAATDSKISVDMHYLVVSPADDGSTNMMNMVSFTNTSAQEYKGDGTSEAVLKVTLPQGATDLNFLDNNIPIKKTDTGFITTKAVAGNQTETLPYSFKMPKDQPINLVFDYPVSQMQVLVPEGMGSVSFQGVEAVSQGTFKFDGQNYAGFSVEGIKANQSFSMVYDKNKNPDNSAAQSQSKSSSDSSVTRSAPAFHNPGHIRMWEESALHNFNPHIFLIVLIAIILAGILSFVYFRRKAKMEEARLGADKEENNFKLLMTKQKTILEKIIELEETHGEGQLTEEDYNKKLAAYKEHLVQVKLSLREYVE